MKLFIGLVFVVGFSTFAVSVCDYFQIQAYWSLVITMPLSVIVGTKVSHWAAQK